jgi:hypothetical protein
MTNNNTTKGNTMLIIRLNTNDTIETTNYVETSEGFHVSNADINSFSRVTRFVAHSDIAEVTDASTGKCHEGYAKQWLTRLQCSGC